MKKIVAALFILFFSATALAQSAGDLNTKGYRLYKQKKYTAAIEAFGEAVKADPNHALAHYNLASTLALLRKLGRTCEADAYKPIIREHLERAAVIDPSRAERMKTDSDLDAVRDTVFYLKLTGTSPIEAKNVATILQNVSWYGKTGDGVFSSLPLEEIKFKTNSRLTIKIVEFGGKPFGPITKTIQGTYTIDGRNIQFILNEPLPKSFGGQKTLKGTLTPEGVLKIFSLDNFTDDHEECSA